MQGLILDRCLYLFKDCRFFFLLCFGLFGVFSFFFFSCSRNTYLLLLLFCLSGLVFFGGRGGLVFNCYLLIVFLQELLKMHVLKAILFFRGILGDRPLHHAISCPQTRCCLYHMGKGPMLLGLAASSSMVLFSPDGHESFSLLCAHQKVS